MTRDEFDAYLSIAAVNWSTLKLMARSPLHYRHRLQNQREDNPRLGLGRAAHTAILEPDKFAAEYAIFTGPTRRGKAWDAFEEANIGKTILKQNEMADVMAMKRAVMAHPTAASYFKAGVAEQTIRWKDRATGLQCKGRVDWVSHSNAALVDLKTTNDIDADRFGRVCARMDYHCQGAFYSDGYASEMGHRLPFVFVVVEVDAPHDVAVYRLGDDELFAGAEKYGELLAKVAECERSKSWPGRYPDEQLLTLPAWVWKDDEEDMGANFGTSAIG